jgi:DNA repair exonuclease SbcCD ATPase subunit
MTRTHIFHIADIHIHAHNYAHIAYAWKQLIAAILAWPNYKKTVVLAIAGDIFDHKMWLQADDITLFNLMMSDLERYEIRTIMMPGNHDYNINQGGRSMTMGGDIAGTTNAADKILALVKTANYKFITHCSLSGIVIIDNLAFFIHSPIDLGTPRPGLEHKDFKKIAMVHEPLTNSKTGSGITFQSQRFSAANFAPIFDLTLLGDIHLPQKLAQNVAYAGSFVQKNRGEGIEHGYFLWEIEKNNGQFIEIPQLSVHIKVSASNDAEPTLIQGTLERPIVARSVQLHYTGCTDEWVRKYSGVLQETYKKPIDGAYNKDKLAIAEVKSAAPQITRTELDEIILAKLNDPSILPGQRDRVLAIHRSAFESRTVKDISPGDWRIRHLSWSNLYCYGEDNWLDFDALENLNSIIGPNKTGKSSIIDILILVLFNETVRGIKKHALNTGARTGHIKCIISVGQDFYSIERAWVDTNTVVVRLYKNGVNISGTDIPNTYQIIENIIGSRRVFVNTAIALQQRQFLVDISSKERYELVCRMIDLDRLRAVEDENKIQIRMEKKQRTAHGDPPNIAEMKGRLVTLEREIEAKNVEIAACTSRIDTIRSRIQLITPDSLTVVPLSCAEISRRVDVIEQLGDFRDQALLTSSLAEQDSVTAELHKLAKEIEFINDKIASLKSNLKAEPTDITQDICNARISAMSAIDISATMSEFTSKNAKKLEFEHKLATLQAELNAASATIKTYESKSQSARHRPSAEIEAEMTHLAKQEFVVDRVILDEIPRLKAAIDANTNILIAQQAKLASINANPRINHAISQQPPLDAPIADVEADIKSYEHLAAGYMQSMESIARLGELMSSNDVKSNSAIFHWNETCADCTHNRGILAGNPSGSAEIATEMDRLNTLQQETVAKLVNALRHAREHYTKETKQLALTIKSDYNQLTSICKRRDAADHANKIQSHLAQELAAAKENEVKLAEISQLRERCENIRPMISELTLEINRTTAAIAAAQDQITMYQSLDKLRSLQILFTLNQDTRYEIANKERSLQLAKADRDRCIKELDRLKTIIDRAQFHKAKIAELNELTSMFETARVAEDARDEINTLNEELSQKCDEHKTMLADLAKVTYASGVLSANIAAGETSLAAITASDMKLGDLELYDRIINHKTGIPVEMMKNVCARIQNKCDEVFEQISDFRIGVVFDDEVHLNVIAGTSVVSAEQASGYQKFIIDIIMRQVLCSLTASGCPRILFVDEGFGSADETNFGVICRNVLPLLARNFEKVIVVSHIAGIHEYTTGNCIIQVNQDKSKLMFGPKDAEKMHLRVITDWTESAKAAHEEKEARKAENKVKKAAAREQKKQDEKRAIDDRLSEIGDTIFTRVDPKTVKCEACNKVYKETLNFTTKHIASAIHMKMLTAWLKKTDAEDANADDE